MVKKIDKQMDQQKYIAWLYRQINRWEHKYIAWLNRQINRWGHKYIAWLNR